MSIRVICPFCSQESFAPDALGGVSFHIKCPRCGALYLLEDYPTKETTEAPMRNITETRDDQRVSAPEHRTFEFTDLRTEKTEDGKWRVTGHAAVFNSLSVPLKTRSGKTFVEKIKPGAFKRSLDSGQEIVMLDDHDAKKVLARTSAKTLKLSEDERGLKFDATLPDTSTARDLVSDIEHRNKTGVSFGFGDAEDEWNMDGATPVRTLLSIPLGEVSPTAFPAYKDTDISVRADQAIARLAAGETDVRCYGMSDRSDHEYAAESCRSAAMGLHEACHRAHEMHMKEDRSFTDHEKRSFSHAHDELRRAVRRANELRSYYRDMFDEDDEDFDDDTPGAEGGEPIDGDDATVPAESRSIADLLTAELQLSIDQGLPIDDLRAALAAAISPPQRLAVVEGQHFVLDEKGEKRVAGPYKFKMQAVRKLKALTKPAPAVVGLTPAEPAPATTEVAKEQAA